MNKISAVVFLIILFLVFLLYGLLMGNNNEYRVQAVNSPLCIILDGGRSINIDGFDVFDSDYTDKNKVLAAHFNMNEDEAFIIGNLGKYWTRNILLKRNVKIYNNDIIYNKRSYKIKFANSPFATKDGNLLNQKAFERQLNTIRQGKYVIVDLDNDNFYPVSKSNRQKVKNFVVIRRSHVKNLKKEKINNLAKYDVIKIPSNASYKNKLDLGNIKIVVSDMTSKYKPDRNCSSDICREILTNIHNATDSIDIAIYGYSSTPEIEKAILRAINRGVKVRLVYDVDNKGGNIYPDTDKFIRLISDRMNDGMSSGVNNTMHNKFYIFDEKTVITGSANLSHTDMSGYNSNAIIVFKSPEVASVYRHEFEQMYSGKFHSEKNSYAKNLPDGIKVYFSPQDKATTNAVLPLLRNAKKYIYIPAFIISDGRVSTELINAHKRGVDIKLIADSLNATNTHSKHKEMRQAGIPVKTENYAGKMHSKSIIVDDEYLLIGSMNFSNSGENRNDENLVLIKNPNAAKFYREFFLYQWSRIPDKWLKYTPRAEGVDSIGSCSDGIDNNYDGKTDMEDAGCIKK